VTVHLRVTGPDGQTRDFHFQRTCLTVGSGPTNDLVLPAEIGAVRLGGLEVGEDGFRFRFGGRRVDVGIEEPTAAGFAEPAPVVEGSWYPLKARLVIGDMEPFVLQFLSARQENALVFTASLPAVSCSDCEPDVVRQLFADLSLADSPEELPAMLMRWVANTPTVRSCRLVWQEDDPRQWLQAASSAEDDTLSVANRIVAAVQSATPLILGERPVHVDDPGGWAVVLPMWDGGLRAFFVLRTTRPGPEVLPAMEPLWQTGHAALTRFIMRHQRACEAAALEEENRYFRDRERRRYLEKEIVAVSPAMSAVVTRLLAMLGDDQVVYLDGEAGTGKELLARAVHHRGGRRDAMMVAIHCGERSPEALEEELFGKVTRGPSGESVVRRGVLEICDGGTVFLEEVHLLAQALQTRLLRVLNDGELIRLGESNARSVSVRVVAASHVDLVRAAADGTFRHDLAHLLAIRSVLVPPLRERALDMPRLSALFVGEFARRYNRNASSVAPDVVAWLQAQTWPGNVRELMMVLERAVLAAPPDAIELGMHCFER
jgi:hypothetical protein